MSSRNIRTISGGNESKWSNLELSMPYSSPPRQLRIKWVDAFLSTGLHKLAL